MGLFIQVAVSCFANHTWKCSRAARPYGWLYAGSLEEKVGTGGECG